MFKGQLDGLYHQEQIKDWIRAAQADELATQARGGARRKASVGIGVASLLGLVWCLANLGQVAAWFNGFK